MSNFFISSIAAVSIMVLGMYLAYLYGRHTKKFRWREYAALLIAPLGIVVWFAWFEGSKVLYFFLASAVVGLALEWLIGLAYHKTLNKRLWTYSRYSLNGYTSWLSLPLWGIGGIIFWGLSKSFGL